MKKMKKMEQKLVDITFDLLYKNGYCDTNIADILKIAKATKGALYYHFTSKHELVVSAITYYLEQILEHHWVDPLANTTTPIDTLVEQVEAYIEMFLDPESFLDIRHGCPLSNFILDMSDKDETFFEYFKSVYSRWHVSIEKVLEKAQEQKQTHTAFNAKEQAMFIISALEGSIGSAKALNDVEAVKNSVAILITHIKSL